MPHLAPLSWALAPILFWFLLFLFMSFIWWGQGLSFPCSSSLSFHKFSGWNWS